MKVMTDWILIGAREQEACGSVSNALATLLGPCFVAVAVANEIFTSKASPPT